MLKMSGEQLLDEPHSFTQSWSGSSGIGDFSGPSKHIASPDKPYNGHDSTQDLTSSSPKSSSSSGNTTTVKGLGKLQFTVSYDSSVQELFVSILRCTDLSVDATSPGKLLR